MTTWDANLSFAEVVAAVGSGCMMGEELQAEVNTRTHEKKNTNHFEHAHTFRYRVLSSFLSFLIRSAAFIQALHHAAAQGHVP